MNFNTLLSSKYFAPLFWTQFLGAFNDNVYKNALIILVTMNAASYTSISVELLIPLSGGIFILPFFLFSALAGQLADKYEKARLIRYVKMGEINIMILAALGFYLENIWFLLAVLFFMGCQSSLFGPVKYSILPQHLTEEGLLKGNAMIELGTFLAILLGTLLGGILILEGELGRVYVSITVVSVALLGWFASRKIPLAESANENLIINWNIFTETWNIIVSSTDSRLIFGAIIAISWFWFVGATMLSVLPLPVFTQDVLHAKEQVITLLLALFSIGVGVGSIVAGKSATLKKSVKWIVVGAIGISLTAIDLYWISNQLMTDNLLKNVNELSTWQALFNDPMTAHVLFSVLLLGVSGGLYIVPLYVILQEHSAIESRSRTIAANNIINSLFMVVSALFTMMLLDNGFSLPQLFALIGFLNLAVFTFLYWRFSVTVKQVIG
ncbi:MFS transporter [sulfur-oxidizing endosymbiont of Gigantopelta aegis]|uniref:MFS transporter n=1 Tax=sulfur-oxidizing endosymbiont of Gigantopelta aegis TaxID=2794934 RepID=UPI0018DBC3D3|nr:MFS transporter [sulfur-oxidizing endosymbiont of Gigantopelta aegis]